MWQTVSAIHTRVRVSLFKAHRLARGWTLEETKAQMAPIMADMGLPPGLTTQRICHYESGERPNGPRLNAWCRLYETRPDRLGIGMDYTPPEDQGNVTILLPEPGTPADAWSHNTSSTVSSTASTNAGHDLEGWAGLLAQASTACGPALPSAMAGLAEQIRRHLTQLMEPTAEVSVRRLGASVASYAAQFSTTPPGRLACDLLADLAETASGLRRPGSARYLAIAARQAALVGLLMLEMGQAGSGGGWLRLAETFAASIDSLAAVNDGDDDGFDRVQESTWLRSWVAALQPEEALAAGDWSRALADADRAAPVATASPLGAALVAMSRAKALAGLGNHASATAALGLAGNAHEKLPEHLTESSWLGYPAALFHADRGGVLLDLTTPHAAIADLRKSLTHIGFQSHRLGARVQMDLLACAIETRQVEDPGSELVEILNAVPGDHRSYRLMLRARQTLARIPPEQRASWDDSRLTRLLGSLSWK